MADLLKLLADGLKERRHFSPPSLDERVATLEAKVVDLEAQVTELMRSRDASFVVR